MSDSSIEVYSSRSALQTPAAEIEASYRSSGERIDQIFHSMRQTSNRIILFLSELGFSVIFLMVLQSENEADFKEDGDVPMYYRRLGLSLVSSAMLALMPTAAIALWIKRDSPFSF